jgi:hypothetical protein
MTVSEKDAELLGIAPRQGFILPGASRWPSAAPTYAE